jgi:hypothetical protein
VRHTARANSFAGSLEVGAACWPGLIPIDNGTLIIDTLRISQASIQGGLAAPSVASGSVAVGRLVVSPGTTQLVFLAGGIYLTYSQIEVRHVSAARFVADEVVLQYVGKFATNGGQSLHDSCSGFVVTGTPDPMRIPGFFCPAQGAIGVILQAENCGTLSCGRCEFGQTCDTAFGLCEGVALFSASESPLATAATTTAAGTEVWVIVVAVVVPSVVVIGVVATLVGVFLMRRHTAQYDSKANNELRENQLQALRATADY